MMEDKLLAVEDAAAHDDAVIVVTPIRWYIVAQFSLFALFQGWFWAIPGPVSDCLTAIYDIDTTTIELLVNYGPIFFIPFALPFGFWIDGGFGRDGLRYSVIISSALVTLGAALRCVARDASTLSLVALHVSFVLNAIAGPVAMSAVGKVSELWFPPGERALSTALAANANGLGTAIAFLVGPLFVSSMGNAAGLAAHNWLCLAVSAANTACIAAYWPSRPRHPPSRSAVASRAAGEAFTLKALWRALAALSRNPQILILLTVYGIGLGFNSGWSSMLSINLEPLGIDNATAGWVGFSASLCANFLGVLVGRLATTRAVQAFGWSRVVVIINVVATAAVLWFTLLVQKLVPWGGSVGYVQAFVSATIANVGSAAVPLYYELAIEATHPLPEGTVVTVLTLLNNIGCGIILLIPISNAGSIFNWAYFVVTGLCTLLVVLYLGNPSARLDVDTGKVALDVDLHRLLEFEDDAEGGHAHAAK